MGCRLSFLFLWREKPARRKQNSLPDWGVALGESMAGYGKKKKKTTRQQKCFLVVLWCYSVRPLAFCWRYTSARRCPLWPVTVLTVSWLTAAVSAMVGDGAEWAKPLLAINSSLYGRRNSSTVEIWYHMQSGSDRVPAVLGICAGPFCERATQRKHVLTFCEHMRRTNTRGLLPVWDFRAEASVFTSGTDQSESSPIWNCMCLCSVTRRYGRASA